ncbi:MAG: hypothetical protein ABIH03_06020 [Pseudomonadota bacterium]
MCVSTERLDDIAKAEVWTRRLARTLIESGSLRKPANRDHCPQYIAAIGLIFGRPVAIAAIAAARFEFN